MAYLRNAWYVAGQSDELGEKPIVRRLLNTPIMLYRATDGGVVMMDDACPHRFAPLHCGTRVGDAIRCPYHGLLFDRDGSCIESPHGDGALPAHAKTRVYATIERHGYVWFWAGEPASADVAKLPDFSIIDDNAGFAWCRGYISIAANYLLVTDNLLDLSHAEHLHPYLATPGWNLRSNFKVRQEGETVYAEYHLPDDPVIPLFQRIIGDPGFPATGDMRNLMRWDAPALLYQDVGVTSQRDPSKGIAALSTPNCHFITPETETSCHYWWAAGRDVYRDVEQLTVQMQAMVTEAFETQDKPIIEGQQSYMPTTDLMALKPAILKGDGAGVRARRLIAAKLRAEAGMNDAEELIAAE